MSELRTMVNVKTTNRRRHEAREMLRVLRDELALQQGRPGPVENWRSPTPDSPTEITIFLEGDVKAEVERRLAAMNPEFDVSVEVIPLDSH